MGADCLHSARIVDIADSVHCAFTLIHCVQFKKPGSCNVTVCTAAAKQQFQFMDSFK